MDPFDKDFVLGSKMEHFEIKNPGHDGMYIKQIVGLNPDLKEKLSEIIYTGPLKIYFPDVRGEHYSIGRNAFEHESLRHVSSIDLSEFHSLQYIDVGAFQNVGCENENFSEINLSNVRDLKYIDRCAFKNVGHKSNYVKITFTYLFYLQFICASAFENVGCGIANNEQQVDGVNRVDKQEISINFHGLYNLENIGQSAFANYNRYTKAKIAKIIFPDNYKQHILEPRIFMNAFGDCDKVIVDLNKKEDGYIGSIIQEECFAGMRIHLYTNENLREIKPKAISAKYLNEGSAKIFFKTNRKIKQILGYSPLQFVCFLENKQLKDLNQSYLEANQQGEQQRKPKEVKKLLAIVIEQAKQCLQEIEAKQKLEQQIKIKKQIIQIQEQFIKEQEQRLKHSMAQLGCLDDRSSPKRLQ